MSEFESSPFRYYDDDFGSQGLKFVEPLGLMRERRLQEPDHSGFTAKREPEKCDREPLYDAIIDTAAKYINDRDKEIALLKRKQEPRCFIKKENASFWASMDLYDLHDEYTKLRTETDADPDPEKAVGFGLVVHDQLRHHLKEPPTISSVMQNSPADRAGVKIGDKIVEINGMGYHQLDFDHLLIGQLGVNSGSRVQLKVQHESEVRSVELQSGEFRYPLVSDTDLGDGIVSLKLRSFFGRKEDPALPAKELEQAILRHPKAKGFVFDLRNNLGGDFDNAIGVSELFIESGVIVQGERRNIHADKFEIYPFKVSVNSDAEFHDGDSGMVQNDSKLPQTHRLFQAAIKGRPVAVLIGNSASASEIVAAALNETAGYPLIGTPTFGKGIGQCVSPEFADGSRVQATCLRWFTPNHEWLGDGQSDRHPLQPTIFVEKSDDILTDAQQDRAVAYLRERLAGTSDH